MSLRPKVTKVELKEKAEETMRCLELEVEEFEQQIALLRARKEDAERKIRWLKREILD